MDAIKVEVARELVVVDKVLRGGGGGGGGGGGALQCAQRTKGGLVVVNKVLHEQEACLRLIDGATSVHKATHLLALLWGAELAGAALHQAEVHLGGEEGGGPTEESKKAEKRKSNGTAGAARGISLRREEVSSTSPFPANCKHTTIASKAAARRRRAGMRPAACAAKTESWYSATCSSPQQQASKQG